MAASGSTLQTDLLVIGGGPAGYTAAFRAAELGLQTILVDAREALGGAWLHEGCILSKELLHLADTIRAAEHAASFGVAFEKPRIDLQTLRAGLRKTVESFASSLDDLCREHGIAHVRGEACFDSPHEVAIRDNPDVPGIRFERAIIATGGVDVPLKCAPAGSRRIMGPGRSLQLEDIPETLLVIAGRPSALELASIYAALGSLVTIVAGHYGTEKPAVEGLAAIISAALPEVKVIRSTDETNPTAFSPSATAAKSVFPKPKCACSSRSPWLSCRCTSTMGSGTRAM